MSQETLDYAEFVELVLGALSEAGIEYLIGGAVAAWAWGEPRSTLDLDVVVNIPLEAAGRLSKALEKRDMLVPAEIILDAVLEGRADIPINAIHMYSGFKADLYPLRPHDKLRQAAFKRRKKVDLGPQLGEVYLHSAEDLIIYKLWYFSLSRQTKHLRDIHAILENMGGEIEFQVIDKWVDEKGLRSLWDEVIGSRG